MSGIPYRRAAVAAGLDQRVRVAAFANALRNLADTRKGTKSVNSWAKRSVDVAVALVGAPFYLPLIIAAALAVKLIDPGPVFYSQLRRGHNGRRFRLLKLRTMYRDADERLKRHLAADPQARQEWCRQFKLSNDPRILPWVGSFLRRSSIDELPQIWNMLRGDMTLVGPRPLPDYHLQACDRDFCQLRQTLVPGLTGLWQVMARSNGDVATLRRLDSFYVRNWSVRLDLTILLLTFIVVLLGKGAR